MRGQVPGGALFHLDGAGVSVGGRVLLHPLDLSLGEAGRVCGLIGHNGSGKSTLLRLLARQRRPSRGRVRFAGRDLQAWPGRKLARHLAYLPQSLPEPGGLTVRELVALGRFPWHGPLGRPGPADRQAVARALETTGMSALAARPVAELSGGEQQCAWIAMCVAQDTRCLLLDEPISALDIAHQVQVMRIVRALCHGAGLAVLVVLHDLNLAARQCDDIVALHGGRVAATGAPGTVMRPATLEAIYGIRLGLLDHPAGGAPIAYVA